MKLLRVINSLDPSHGGPSYSVRESSNMLAALGHTVTVVTLDSESRRLRAKVDFEYLRLGPGVGSYGFSVSFARWMLRNASEYDVVMVHGIWQFPSLVSSMLRARCNRLLVMPHGSLDVWDRHESPLKFRMKQLYWLLVERPLYRNATCMFTSDVEREQAIDQFNFKGVRTEVVPYGAVDTGIYRESLVSSDLSTFGYLGRLHPKKGVDLLIRAFAAYIEDGCAGELLIAGGGDDAYVSYLRGLVSDLGVQSRVRFVGTVSGGEKSKFLMSLGLFVLPSMQENFGLAVAEALCAGTPVLISDQVNIHSVVSSFDAGVVQSRDVASFTSAMKDWAQRLGRDADVRRRARDCFRAAMSLDGFVRRVLTVSQTAS